MTANMRDEMFERDLPPYLVHDLDAWKTGVGEKSCLLDFTGCEQLQSRAYNGASGKKIGYAYFIDDTPCLTDLQRKFYKMYLTAWYEVLFG